jgi:poly(A) polymerase
MILRLTANPALQAASHIAATLRAAGFAAYFAGGCVRDLLLDHAAKDFDVATSATPPEIVALFPRTQQVGAHFGVILVQLEVAGTDTRTEDTTTEVATFRHDGAYLDGRRPDAVRFTNDPREDVQRRDFTINGMLLDPAQIGWPILDAQSHRAAGWVPQVDDSAVLDFVGGREDLAQKVVRTIGSPELRFTEDKLRMLRGVRFAARFDFAIAPETLAAIQLLASEIAQVSCERVRDELTRMLTEGHARRAFELLDASGLLAQILPEITRMHGVRQPPEYHPEGDVFVHTMLLLAHLPPGASPTLAWGMLLHDVGKPATFQPPNPAKSGDRIRFNGHVEVGVRIAEEILRRLRFSNDDAEQIVALVKNHMRFGDILQMKQSTLKRFLRLPRFDEHLELHRLDASSAHGDLTLYDFARAQYEAEPTPDLRPAPLLTGDDLIAAGYRPSPQFKPMLALAEDAQLEGSINSREQALELVQAMYPLAAAGAHQ